MVTLVNRAKMSTSTTGTGTITLGSAETGYQTFADAGVADGDVVRYVIEDGNDWEIGSGTYTSSGTTLSRTVDESSNAGAALNLTGSAVVFITAAAGDVFQGELFAENPSSPTAPSATGTNAVAIGSNTTATGQNAFAIGIGDGDATGTNAFAVAGQSTNTSTIAIGTNSRASGFKSVSIGADSDATGTRAVAIGADAQAISGANATAIADSYASGTDSFAAAIANNTSSYGATGSNSIAIGQQAKASSSNAVSIGGLSGAPSLASNSLAVAIGWATASGSGAFAVGNNSQATATQLNSVAISGNATATYSTAIGKSSDNANASASGSGGIGLSGALAQGQDSLAVLLDARSVAANSVAIGSRARANQIGKFAFANGRFSVAGDVQSGTFILRSDTTDATAEALTTNNSTASTTNQIILPNNSAYAFHGTIVARQQASGGTASAAWKIEGLIRREGSAGTTVLVNSATTVLDNTPSWGLALSADTTNGGLAITVTGAASTNIRWVATIHTSEVTYA